jgi:hypothetical protein
MTGKSNIKYNVTHTRTSRNTYNKEKIHDASKDKKDSIKDKNIIESCHILADINKSENQINDSIIDKKEVVTEETSILTINPTINPTATATTKAMGEDTTINPTINETTTTTAMGEDTTTLAPADTDTETEKILEAKYINFNPQEILYYNRVNSYFKSLEERKFKHMVDILNFKADISLRLLEWFITKYCDKYKTTKCTKENGESFVIYVGYKAALKSYRKRYFDPFKRNQKHNQLERKQKFLYVCTKNGNEYKVNTTLGQLHFFRWLFENNILNYIIKNLDKIKGNMEHDNRLVKKRKDEDRKNGVKKTKNKTDHKKISKNSGSSSVEINTSSLGKSSLVISFD